MTCENEVLTKVLDVRVAADDSDTSKLCHRQFVAEQLPKKPKADGVK